jgi:hypothetical protein
LQGVSPCRSLKTEFEDQEKLTPPEVGIPFPIFPSSEFKKDHISVVFLSQWKEPDPSGTLCLGISDAFMTGTIANLNFWF